MTLVIQIIGNSYKNKPKKKEQSVSLTTPIGNTKM